METRQDAIRRENKSLKERNVALEALVRQLRLLPGSDAHGVLERIRTIPNMDQLLMLNAARGHCHVAQLSAEKIALSTTMDSVAGGAGIIYSAPRRLPEFGPTSRAPRKGTGYPTYHCPHLMDLLLVRAQSST